MSTQRKTGARLMVMTMLPIAQITAAEVGERIAQMIKNILLMGLVVLRPIVAIIALGAIIYGGLLLLFDPVRWKGAAWIMTGIMALVFTYVLAPELIQMFFG